MLSPRRPSACLIKRIKPYSMSKKDVCILLFIIISLCFCLPSFADNDPNAEAVRTFYKAKRAAALLVNGETIFRISSSSEAGTSAFDRVEFMASRINKMTEQGVNVGSVEPSMIDNIAVGIVGDIPVFSVEPGDALDSSIPSLLLAYDWSNRLRRAFKAPLLSQSVIDDIIKIERMKGNRIEVIRSKWQDKSQLVVNGKVVMELEGYVNNPYEKAREVAQNVEDLVMSGKDTSEIKPAFIKGDIYALSIGDTVVPMLDEETASALSIKGWKTVLGWTNQIRESLGGLPFSSGSLNSSLTQFGKASWYGGFFHGRRTSSGERYNMYDMTAAHKKLPFGTEVLVTRLDNAKSVIVRITDRGPYVAGRIIDLSRSAAEVLGLVHSGVAKVRIDVIKTPEQNPNKISPE